MCIRDRSEETGRAPQTPVPCGATGHQERQSTHDGYDFDFAYSHVQEQRLKPRHKRLALIVGGLAILAIAATLVLNAFQSNLVFFFSPTQVAAGEAPKGKNFRIGGMVKDCLLYTSRCV